jgi:hypothetical protein
MVASFSRTGRGLNPNSEAELWRQASLPDVEPWLPARRKETDGNRGAQNISNPLPQFTVLSGRQRCRPPRQARMPDATNFGVRVETGSGPSGRGDWAGVETFPDATGSPGDGYFFPALILAHRALAAATILARPAALSLPRFLVAFAGAAAGAAAAPTMRLSSLCNSAIRSLSAAAFRNCLGVSSAIFIAATILHPPRQSQGSALLFVASSCATRIRNAAGTQRQVPQSQPRFCLVTSHCFPRRNCGCRR